MIHSRTIGTDAELYQVIEFHGPTHDAQWMLPGVAEDALQANLKWLSPEYYMPITNRLVFTFQLWVLRFGSEFVIVDTGVGNEKTRLAPSQHMLNNPVLDWLRAIGADPARVRHVVCTHLHGDHVGWNTQLVDGRWEPTFPNATYHLPRTDWEVYSERHEAGKLARVFDDPLQDSVLPIVTAGLARFVDDGDDAAGLRAIAAPGHTPGNLVYALDTGSEKLLFTGDVLHSPVQVLDPTINSRWCELQDQARTSRHELLTRAAREGATIVPAHAKRMQGWHVVEGRNGFWLDVQQG